MVAANGMRVPDKQRPGSLPPPNDVRPLLFAERWLRLHVEGTTARIFLVLDRTDLYTEFTTCAVLGRHLVTDM